MRSDARLARVALRDTIAPLRGPAAALGLAAAVGAIAAVSPPLGIGVGLGGAAAFAILRTGVPSMFHMFLAVLLVGYAFFGRSFAYLGVAPVYVGEIALGLGLLTLLRLWTRFRPRLLEWLLIAFMVLGALDTVPYIARDGIDAFRDAVLWGYGVFALALFCSIRAEHFPAIVSIYRRLVPLFLLWVPLAALLTLQLESVPSVPGSDVPILIFKGGDIGTHLGGIAAFLVVGLFSGGPLFAQVAPIALLPLWLTALALVGLANRGGLLAASIAWLCALVLRPTRRWVLALITAVGLVSAVVALAPATPTPFRRETSASEILSSIFFESPSLEGTKYFRLQWWGDIIGYTFVGPYFWTGKGFGVNLADDDGFQVTIDHSLRAPHNSHLSVLARTGVPGFVLWIVLQAAFAASLVRAHYRSRNAGALFWSHLDVWLLGYWLAMVVNTSFDPYLEGPQGGIWFWSVFGLGLAALRAQREDRAT